MRPIVNEAIEKYCLRHTTQPSRYCQAIHDYTRRHVPYSQMLIGPFEAGFLRFLLKLIRAKRVLEIGCFTGYSALAMAECLPKTGQVITLDVNPETTRLAQQFWKKAPDGGKIKLILGNALTSLNRLKGTFDFVFIDADKTNYLPYLRKALSLLSPNGMIAADNCLWGGDVLKRHAKEKDTKAIQRFNRYVSRRKDLEVLLAPIRDGIFLIQKKRK